MVTRQRIQQVLATGVALAALVAGSNGAAGEAPTIPKVWTLGSWERALRSEAPRAVDPVLLYAAQGEWESFQIAVRGDRPARVTAVEVSPLSGEGGAAIPTDGVRCYRAHQLEIRKGTYRNDAFKADWYPDALIPFRNPLDGSPLPEARFRALPFDLPAGETHTFWIDVHVPDDAKAGDYRGEAAVTFEGGSVARVPVAVHVWPFALPKRATMKTEFGSPAPRILAWYRDQVSKGKVKAMPDERALHVACARLTSEHRMNSWPQPELMAHRPGERGDFALSAEQIAGLKSFVARYQVNALAAPPPAHFFKDPAADRERIAAYLKSWDRVLDAIGDPDLLCYTYLIDEPNDSKAYEYTRAWGKAIRSAGSKVKVLVTEQTKTQDEAWGDLHGAIDIWVPLFSLFDPETAAKRRALGESIWTYTALCQGKPTPWWHTDFPLFNYRIPCWMAWLDHMEGLLYWGGMAHWSDVDDPWTDPGTYPKLSERRDGVYNGEGTLLYPGEAVGFAGAVPSMRLKALRDGLEDFEYLMMLDRAGKRSMAEALIAPAIRGWYDWSASPDRYAETRRKFGCLISGVTAAKP